MGTPAAVARELVREDSFFLPDFCGMRTVFLVVLVAELLAFVLVLAGDVSGPQIWDSLALLSLFVQWSALLSAAVLCGLRPWLRRLSLWLAAGVSYLAILVVVAGVGEVAYMLLYSGFAQPGIVLNAHGEFLLRNMAIGAIIGAVVLRYFYVQQQWRQRLESETRVRIEALQARIRPHFLFNSMNTIASLIRVRPELAEEAVLDLAELYRATLTLGDGLVPLAAELGLARRYLGVERLRLGERLAVEWELDDAPQDVLLPVLSIQPLVENAVYHGVERLERGGTVRIAVQRDRGRICVKVSNPVAPGGAQQRAHGSHMAIENITERLHAYFGRRGSLRGIPQDARFCVEMCFPEVRSMAELQ